MTIYVIGDYHGKTLESFVEQERPSEEDRIFSLGDFDTVESIKDYLSLKERVGGVVEVGGNHDKALQEDRKLISRSAKTPEEIVEDVKHDEVSQEYLNKLLSETNREFEFDGLKGVLTHSGLTGYNRNPNVSESMRPFTYRLWEVKDFHDNFDVMQQDNYDIMIRGHEHYTEHAKRSKDSGDLSFNLPEPGDEYKIDNDHRHIITNGPWLRGDYLEIDPEERMMTFRNAEV